MPDDPLLKSFMFDSCEKISSPEANQAFRSGVMNKPAACPVPRKGRRRKGHTSCVKKGKQLTDDESWAKMVPKLTESLEVKKQSSALSRGLFVRKSFKRGFENGDAIGEYVGERILEDEYQSRIEQYGIDKEFNYMVGVDKDDEVSGLYVDATKKGNWTRFVNNAHEPNAQFEPVIISGTWRIYLVAAKKIRPGEEVTIDYGAEYRAPDQKFVKCVCHSKLCSGVIGVPLEKNAIAKLLLNDIHYQDDDLNILCAENRLLEAQNKQLRMQISMIKPMIVDRVTAAFNEVFIPLDDRRPADVRQANSRVVQELMNQELAITGGPAATVSLPESTGSSSSMVAVITNSRRSSSRVSNSSKRSAAAEAEDESQVTPPVKKKRKSPRLSVQKIADCTIESSVSDAPKSPSPGSSHRLPLVPSPTQSCSMNKSNKHHSRSVADIDSDDDIIDVTPSAPRALPAPSRASLGPVISVSPKKQDLSVVTASDPRGGIISCLSLTDKLIEWYKKMRLLPASYSKDEFAKHHCPIHKKDKLGKMRDVRKHFFLNHAGAANTYKQQLEQMGQSLSEAEKALFDESQKIRIGPQSCAAH